MQRMPRNELTLLFKGLFCLHNTISSTPQSYLWLKFVCMEKIWLPKYFNSENQKIFPELKSCIISTLKSGSFWLSVFRNQFYKTEYEYFTWNINNVGVSKQRTSLNRGSSCLVKRRGENQFYDQYLTFVRSREAPYDSTVADSVLRAEKI